MSAPWERGRPRPQSRARARRALTLAISLYWRGICRSRFGLASVEMNLLAHRRRRG